MKFNFEKELIKFLKEKGFKAQIFNVKEGQKIIYVTKESGYLTPRLLRTIYKKYMGGQENVEKSK